MKMPLRALITSAAVLALSLGKGHAQCQNDFIDVRGDFGSVRFSIEIVDTVEERAVGLMHRESLPQNSGMLFVYDRPQRTAFWMKNTLIPLDMLFMGSDGTITHIHENAIPGDLTPISGNDQVLAVLEINGGLSAKYGISVGSYMRHEIFDQDKAFWPC